MMKSDPKAQFANIIEKINEGFVALDAGMNYTYINQRGSELLRRKLEELIGKNYCVSCSFKASASCSLIPLNMRAQIRRPWISAARTASSSSTSGMRGAALM
jgi:transcriptional regulator with PAS, ATPase and Fis domain